MIELGIAAATSPYWIPFVVTLCTSIAGGVTTVAAYFIGRRQRAPNKKQQKLDELRKQQKLKNDEREEALDGLVASTKKHVKGFNRQSQAQLEESARSNQVFDAHLLDLKGAKKRLDRVVQKVPDTYASYEENMKKMTVELEGLKDKLIASNKALQEALEALNKEQDLNSSLMHLSILQEQLSQETEHSKTIIHALSEQLTKQMAGPEHLAYDEEEIKLLKEENQAMSKTMRHLEETLVRVSNALSLSKSTEAKQSEKIKVLLHENARLKNQLTELAIPMEEMSQKSQDSSFQGASSVRLFKPGI